MASEDSGKGALERFKATYFAECAERQETIESTLDSLGAGTDNASDDIRELFRAVHSIKGGAAAFAFAAIVALSHAFETVLGGVA
jgi:two-component system chemotaxis sensor kinase CheA